jgi:NADPH:quinone reductase-like Zn-dependent oxidoreductase
VITEFGEESKLAIVESEIAEPAAREVQVAVEYSVVAGADVNMRRVLIRFKRRRRSRPVIA